MNRLMDKIKMVSYVSVDNLCWEIQAVMKNNFEGTPTQRFNQTKKLLVENFKQIIEDNRRSEIKEFKEKLRD